MKHFLSSEMDNSPADKALFHIIPAPMEMSVSYGTGAAGGPEAIIEASDQLEEWDGASFPCREGIHTCGMIKEDEPADFIESIRKQTLKTLEAGAVPVLLGGEHTVTLGAAEAFYEKFGNRVGLVQIDAHADLRWNYQGNPYSHASVIRKIHEKTGWSVYQVGIRALCEEELAYQKEQGIYCLTGKEAAAKGVKELILPDDFPEFLYLTFDIDGLDSSQMPATGTPVPGGLDWYQSLSLIESLAEQRKIIGFDLVELAPSPAFEYCNFTAAQTVYNIMGIIQRQNRFFS